MNQENSILSLTDAKRYAGYLINSKDGNDFAAAVAIAAIRIATGGIGLTKESGLSPEALDLFEKNVRAARREIFKKSLTRFLTKNDREQIEFITSQS